MPEEEHQLITVGDSVERQSTSIIPYFFWPLIWLWRMVKPCIAMCNIVCFGEYCTMLTALVRASLSVLCFAGIPEPGGVFLTSTFVGYQNLFCTKVGMVAWAT
jgi:hypothetical protein